MYGSLLVLASLEAQANKAKLPATDLTRIRQLVYVAPGGKKAVYAVTSVEPDPEQGNEYKYVSHL